MNKTKKMQSVRKTLLFIIAVIVWCFPLAAFGFNGDSFALHRQSGMSQFVVKTDNDRNFFIEDAENGLGSWDEIAYNSGGPLAIPVPGYWDDDDEMDMAVYRTDKKKLYVKYASEGFAGSWQESYSYDVNQGASFDVFALHRRSGRSLLVIKTDNDRNFFIDDAENGLGSFDLEIDGAGGPLAIPVTGYWDDDDEMDMAVYRTDKKKLYVKYASAGFAGSWHDSFQYDFNRSEANLGGGTLGPTISVGLDDLTEDELEDGSFRIRAYEPGSDDPLPYTIKDKEGNLVANVAAGVQTRVKYIGSRSYVVYNFDGSTEETSTTTVEETINFEYKNDDDRNDIYFDIYHTTYSGYDQFRGKIQLRHYDPAGADNDRIWVINFLPLEHYVWGMGEITGTGDMEYNRVMTISYRTYGYWKLKYSTAFAAQGFKVNATPGNQIYRGYVWETTYDRIRPAAEYTRGKIVMYGDRIAITPYSSWTDGRTRSFEERWGSSNYPWCQSVKDPYGDYNGDYWNNSPSKSTSQLVSEGNHMVGLSAHGALDRAGAGWSYTRILKYYFTGIDVYQAY